MALGADVRRLRQARGMSLEALAERAKLSTNYVGSIERDRRDPSLSSVRAIARALDVPVAELLGDERDQVGAVALEAARQIDRLSPHVQDAIVGLLRSLTGEATRTTNPRRRAPKA